MTAFLLVSLPRSGGRMIQTALNSHPDIECQDELFNYEVYKENKYKNIGELIHYALTEKQDLSARGFRLLADQPLNDMPERQKMVLSVLQNMTWIKVVFIQRLNLFDQFASEQVAQYTKVWEVKNSKKLNYFNSQLIVTTKDFSDFCEKATRRIIQNQKNFRNHESITVFYEDNLDYNLLKIQRFIGVEPTKLSPLTLKQANKSAREILRFVDGIL